MLDIRKMGAVKKGHKLGEHFVKSARELTDSICFIEDSEMKEFFQLC